MRKRLGIIGLSLCGLLTFANPVFAGFKSEIMGFGADNPFLGYSYVNRVDAGSSASISNIDISDWIRRINGKKVSKMEDYEFTNALDKDFVVIHTHGVDIFVHNIKRSGVEFGCELLEDMFQTDLSEKIVYSNITQQPAGTIFSKYNEFFKINNDTLYIQYKGFDKEKVKSLKKKERVKYERVENIYKLANEHEYLKALEIDKEYLPTYLYIYNKGVAGKFWGNVLYALEKLEEVNKEKPIFNQNTLNVRLGVLYYIYGLDEKALEYLSPYSEYAKDSKNQALAFILAEIHNNLKNYSTSIYYLNQIKGNSKYYKRSIGKKYEIYKTINNKGKIKETLIKIIEVEPTFKRYLELCNYATNTSEKLQYYYNAKKFYSTDRGNNYQDYVNLNKNIEKLEQAKIDTAARKINAYYERPQWAKYVDKFSEYTNSKYKYQDKFFEATNRCIQNHSGYYLKKCFADVNTEQNNLLKDLKEDYYRDLEFQRQQQLQNELIYEQRRMHERQIEEIRKMHGGY